MLVRERLMDEIREMEANLTVGNYFELIEVIKEKRAKLAQLTRI